MDLPSGIQKHIEEYSEKIAKYDGYLAKMYKNCYASTLKTALEKCDDGSYFVLTGDIPAMWLRDSTAQVSHYIPVAKHDKETAEIIKGVINRQLFYIEKDAYANAFNKNPDNAGHVDDIPPKGEWVWERKYEIDSLCYPIRLLYLYTKATGDRSMIDDKFVKVCEIITDLWITEQHHFEKSPYRFTRNNTRYIDTLHNNGMGEPVSYTGMTWSGFRPSDDACAYGYLIPSNMFVSVVLSYMAELLENNALIDKCCKLKSKIDKGIKDFGIVNHVKYGKIYCCETDGNGNYRLFDDANVPSLLSAPYIGYCSKNDEIYENTRDFILSDDNPFYYKGKYGKGVGSPHTPEGYIWHIALSMQGLTSKDKNEMREIIEILKNSDGKTGFMHEGFNADNPNEYTREWFTWSDSLFAEFIEKSVDEGVI